MLGRSVAQVVAASVLVVAACTAATRPTPEPTLSGPIATSITATAAAQTPTPSPSASGPTPYGSPVSPAAPCEPEAPTGPIPTLALRTSDGKLHIGEPHGTWRGQQVGPAGWEPPDRSIPVTIGSPMQVLVRGDICALDWTIFYAPPPPGGPAPWKPMPAGDLVPSVADNRDPHYASQNRFDLAALPKGNWVIAVSFTFAHGQELTEWRVDIR
jgi:hypothetical protein